MISTHRYRHRPATIMCACLNDASGVEGLNIRKRNNGKVKVASNIHTEANSSFI